MRRGQRIGFISRHERGVLQGLLDILRLQVRILFENVLGGHTVGNHVHHMRGRDAHTAQAGPSTHDLRIKGNAIEHGGVP